MVQKSREGELYDSMAPLLWCPDLSLVCCSAIPGCSPGPRKSTTNSEQPAVDPLVLLTFGPLRRCRYATDIVAVELAADSLVVMIGATKMIDTFGPLRRCRYATDIVTVELAVDQLVVLVFRRSVSGAF